MPIPLIVYAAGVATMTLRSDTKPVAIYVESPKGTLYWGGAGLDGDYINPTLDALRKAGIENVSVGLTNTGTRFFPRELKIAGTIIDAFRAGVSIRHQDDGEWAITRNMQTGRQFNLIGYSYGSLLAAQTANFYARNGIEVHNLVLIGSPIAPDFLDQLRSRKKILKISIFDIPGDDIHAGMSQAELINPAVLLKLKRDMEDNKGAGHFYYGHMTPDLPRRLAELAKNIRARGLA